MPTCRKCGTLFPNWIKVDGQSKLLSSRKYCLDCSPYKKRNTRNLEKEAAIASDPVELPSEKICLICKNNLPQSSFGIYKSGGKWRIFSYCKKCDSKRTKDFYLEFKKKAVEYKGGKCEKCGYCRCLKALEFHHKISKEKEVAISRFRIRNWELFKIELDKCSLLCSNCHREEHDKPTLLGENHESRT